jgi:hypothetical protein
MVGEVKRFKYRALVRIDPPGGGHREEPLPGSGCRLTVRARHHETHRSKFFSALVNTADGEPLQAAGHSIQLTMSVLGDDACDYLDAGDDFFLWRGHDIGHGVISRSLPMWSELP